MEAGNIKPDVWIEMPWEGCIEKEYGSWKMHGRSGRAGEGCVLLVKQIILCKNDLEN